MAYRVGPQNLYSLGVLPLGHDAILSLGLLDKTVYGCKGIPGGAGVDSLASAHV